jgi:purine-binding chemotaxis protein CheW
VSGGPLIPVLLFRLAGLTCAVPAQHVVETMRPLPVLPIDDMPPFVQGVATIRGTPTPVLNPVPLLGRPASAPARFVTLRGGNRVAALPVDEVLGVVTLDTAQLDSRPSLLSSAGPQLVTGLAMKDGALHLVLDATRLVEAASPS